jgi:hypothetical protein
MGACVRPAARRDAPSTASVPDFGPWSHEARSMVADAQAALRMFDDFQAFRVSIAAESGRRLASELSWDPPTSTTWDQATRIARGLRGRAELLFATVTTASVDAARWREQRSLADAVRDLIDLGTGLGAYRDRVEVLAPGDAAGALGLLDAAWAQWDTAAARWSLGRAEPIECQS